VENDSGGPTLLEYTRGREKAIPAAIAGTAAVSVSDVAGKAEREKGDRDTWQGFRLRLASIPFVPDAFSLTWLSLAITE
jgi:hypothetical protein